MIWLQYIYSNIVINNLSYLRSTTLYELAHKPFQICRAGPTSKYSLVMWKYGGLGDAQWPATTEMAYGGATNIRPVQPGRWKIGAAQTVSASNFPSFPQISKGLDSWKFLKWPMISHDAGPKGHLDPFPNQPTDLHVFASGGPCVQTRWAWRSCLPQTSRLMVFDLDPKAMAFLGGGTENINQGTPAAPTFFLDRFSHHNSL